MSGITSQAQLGTSNTATSAVVGQQARVPDPTAIADKIIADNGGISRPNLSEIKRNLDAIKIQDPVLGAAVRTEIESRLTAVQRGQLASASYVQGGVTISENAKTPQQQFSAAAGSADRENYARLDKMFGDGNPRTNDSALITRKINEQIASGLPLDRFLAQEKAVEAGWTAKAADFLVQFSPAGLLAQAAQPGIAYLTRQAGLGNTEWGGHLQRVLDTPGTARAFNAGLTEGMLNGAQSMVVGIASAAGRLVQYGADNSALGGIGDFARSVVPDGVKDWLRSNGAADVLNETLPSARRGEASTQALGGMATKIGEYFSTRSPGQVAEDVKNAISAQWDSLKADPPRAAAEGPQAEARWWGEVTGRITFEVAATFIPVAGVAGKAAAGARVADTAADALRVGDKIGDVVRASDKVVDGTRVFSSLVMEASRRTGIAPEVIEGILKTEKSLRPDVADYVSPARLAEHARAFENGGSRFTLQSSLDKYGLGQRDGTTFILSKADADRIIANAAGDPRKLEAALGLPVGQLDSAKLVRVDFTPKALDDLGVRMPNGREAGANDQWLPGGILPSGANEAVIDGARAARNQYTITVIGK